MIAGVGIAAIMLNVSKMGFSMRIPISTSVLTTKTKLFKTMENNQTQQPLLYKQKVSHSASLQKQGGEMKRVIENGNRAVGTIFEHRCPQCGCLFEFEQEDVTNTFFDQREGKQFWYIECPECGDKTGFVKPKAKRIEKR